MQTKHFILMVILAFAGVISFFQIQSAFADKHHLNVFFTVLGIAFIVAAIAVFIYKGIVETHKGK